MPSGTQVFDWTVPREWNIRDAWIATRPAASGWSTSPTRTCTCSATASPSAQFTLDELRPHLYTDPDQPDVDPVPHLVLQGELGLLPDPAAARAAPRGRVRGGDRLDASPTARVGYGECWCPARARTRCWSRPTSATPRSPTTTSPASCSRPRWRAPRRPEPRLVPLPLRPRHDRLDHLAGAERGPAGRGSPHGLVAGCVGDPGPLTYKRSRRGDAEIDRAVARVLGGRRRARALRPARLRRAAVLLAGLRPAGRRAVAHARRTGSPSTTPRPTTSTWCGRARSANPSRATSRSSTCSSATGVYLNLDPRASRSSASAASTADRRRVGHRGRALLWVLNQSDGEHDLLDDRRALGSPLRADRRRRRHAPRRGPALSRLAGGRTCF